MSASAGRVLILPKGPYNSGTTYNMLDLVSYNNAAYICKKTTTGNAPTDNEDNEWWMLLVIGSTVQGVKGNAEVSYRDGNVNLTPANLGIYPFSASTLPMGGLVPPAEIGDETKFLKGNSEWTDLPKDGIPLKVSKSSINSLPALISNASITSEMECKPGDIYLSNPAAQTGDWTVTTSNGSATISGSISGTTDVTLWLTIPRTS